MAYLESIPVNAGADLSDDEQYKAIAIGGTIAATGNTTIGILQNKPKSGEDATLGYAGRSRYRAGAAVAAGGLMTVTGSGWLVTVSSGDVSVGKALGAVSSGGIGEGIFNFVNGLQTS